jgi:superfamily II DNA or RNA helicase
MNDYETFLASKVCVDPLTGIDKLPNLSPALFEFQSDITKWALRRGRAALFAGTGLGKTLMEISWARAIHQSTGGDILILTPLAVAQQFVREGDKFDISVNQCKTQAEVAPGITVTNYEKLDHFNLDHFVGVILDESSILKAYDGKTRTRLIAACQSIPYRLAATATPAPNDFMELGNHAEFLGVMSYTDMLSTFFVHDGGETQKWRLKGHAEDAFWKWMCSWAVTLQHPRDLGYDNAEFDLPELHKHQHIVDVDYGNSGDMLFPIEARTMQERLSARRSSINERVAMAATITPSDKPFVWWCHLNNESDALARAIPDAVEVRGSDSEDQKERKLIDFSEGRIRVLVTKPKICGFGMNWQHCADTGFVGLSDSFEQVYQAIRRFWRFGQQNEVNVHFIAAETEGAVVANIRRKEADADRMLRSMVVHMADLASDNIRGLVRDVPTYAPEMAMSLPKWMGEKRASN